MPPDIFLRRAVRAMPPFTQPRNLPPAKAGCAATSTETAWYLDRLNIRGANCCAAQQTTRKIHCRQSIIRWKNYLDRDKKSASVASSPVGHADVSSHHESWQPATTIHAAEAVQVAEEGGKYRYPSGRRPAQRGGSMMLRKHATYAAMAGALPVAFPPARNVMPSLS